MFSIELKYALRIVSELERSRLAGEPVTTADLRRGCGHEIMTFNKVMFFLNRSKWIDNGDYPALLVDLHDKSLFDLAEAIGDPAISEHDYMYGWSADSLSGSSTAVDISKTLNEEYRDRLSGMSLPALVTGLTGTGRKRTVKKRIKSELICRRQKGTGGIVNDRNT